MESKVEMQMRISDLEIRLQSLEKIQENLMDRLEYSQRYADDLQEELVRWQSKAAKAYELARHFENQLATLKRSG
jgi:predicted  nucleic acid-binding Zn-ribbon protein